MSCLSATWNKKNSYFQVAEIFSRMGEIMKKAWLMASVAILTGIVFAIGLFKVPPIMLLLMQEMQIDMTVIGLTMSVAAIAGAISALPGGAIMQKIGSKNLGIIAIAIYMAGCVIGLISTNFTIFLLSRALEGAAFGSMALVISGIISIWFPAEKRGLPMSIFSLWISLGMLTILNMANLIVPNFGWRGLWWFHLILLAICGVLFIFVIKYPENMAHKSSVNDSSQPKISILEGFKSPGAWLLGIAFMTTSIGNTAFNTFYPTFLQQSLGLDMAASNLYTSISTGGMIACGLLIGFLLNRVKNKNHPIILLIAVCLTAAISYAQFQITSVAVLPVFLFFLGVIFQSAPPIFFTIAPDTATRPETIAATLAVITTCSAVGGIIGPMILGPIVAASAGKWAAVSMPLLLILLIGVLASLFTIFVMKKKYHTVEDSIKSLV